MNNSSSDEHHQILKNTKSKEMRVVPESPTTDPIPTPTIQ